MNRACRAASVFLLTLAVAIPAAAGPSLGRVASKERILTTLWARLTAIVGVFDNGRAGADPNGTNATPPAPTTNPQAEEGDSRAGADPDG